MGKSSRRIFQNFILVLGCTLLLAACGPGETVQPSPSGGEELSFFSAGGRTDLDLAIESSAFYDVASELEGGKFVCMQYYQGEPVQFWASAADRAAGTVSVYMYHQDGTRETCLEKIERFRGQNICFRDSEGCYYSIDYDMNKGDSIIKLDDTGKTLYTTTRMGRRIKEPFCELPDGRLAMLTFEGTSQDDFEITLLDAEGEFTAAVMSETLSSPSCIGTSEEGLLLMMGEYLYRVDIPGGKLERLFSFAQTVYSVWSSRDLCAFRVRRDGKLDLLRADLQGSGGQCEALSLIQRDGSRAEVVLRGLNVEDKYWLKEQALKFNSSNDRYLVVIEGLDQGDDKDDFVIRTGVEIATGKGPDILVEGLIESPASLIEKGGLVDLAPLMEQAGIKEDDYFPMAFDTWRTGDSIYSIRFFSNFKELRMSSDVLGDMEYPDIETVLDAMLAYPENVSYNTYADWILRELLEGSETLWGMVDWENGTCDFGVDLFVKLLEVAKRYGYDARTRYPSVVAYRTFGSIYGFYTFPTREESRAKGYVSMGQLFDDGSHPISWASDSFSINANAANPEGAWEFLQFLLGDEAQESMLDALYTDMPVKRSVFWAAAEKEMMNGNTRNYAYPEGGRITEPPSRERVEEIAALIENVRALPYKTETILEIVLEEAQDYFDGVKEIPQVVDAVENRVGLYLQERR